MARPCLLRRTPLLAGLVASSALVWAVRPSAPLAVQAAEDPLLIPHLIDAARVLGPVACQLTFYVPRAAEAPTRVRGLRVLSEGALLVEQELDVALRGDARYGQLNALAERLPEELAHRHGPRRFAPADAPELAGHEVVEALQQIEALLLEIRELDLDPARRCRVALDFTLHLDQIFWPEDPAGTLRTLELAVDYLTPAGQPASASTTATIRRLPPRLELPEIYLASNPGASAHAGDLHVHTCHGEAAGACSPSGNCGAETLQTSGSYSIAQLKSQYLALGMDWVTFTDHSYCIDSAGEYAALTAEIAAANDPPNFVGISDNELSSDEAGPQNGASNLGDLVCFGTTSANHMGAHGISSWIEGGDQGFQGFCDGLFGGDALRSFLDNIALVRAQGGYPIVNHPAASSFGWQSEQATLGIEAGAMHGVEIWNGASVSGQGGDVGRWVDWLLAGRLLYGYSGSDTHDQAFWFGANHALLEPGQTLNAANVEQAIGAGRVYVSEGHVLVIEVDDGAKTLGMGCLQAIGPAQPASPLTVRVHYNFGAETSQISIWRGREGDAGESLLCQSGLLTGAGVYECNDALTLGRNSWYRAYSQASGPGGVAYTNPVFFVHGSCQFSTYGLAAGGTNIGTLTSASSPTIGSTVSLDLAGFTGSALGFFMVSGQQLLTGVPLFGGTLYVGLQDTLFLAAPLAGGAGTLNAELPAKPSLIGKSAYWQALGVDLGVPGSFVFSNGLAMTICGLGQ